MNVMNIDDFKAKCESFFALECFKDNDSVIKLLSNRKAIDYLDWKQNLIQAYNAENNSVVKNLIKDIREEAGFVIYKDDFDNDPVAKKENQELINKYRDVLNDTFNNFFEKFDFFKVKEQELKDFLAEKNLQEKLKVSVGDKSFVAEKVVDVLWSGWECDNYAWLVNDNGEKKIVASNHGDTYFTDKSFLEGKIKEYEDAINATKEMLSLLK